MASQRVMGPPALALLLLLLLLAAVTTPPASGSPQAQCGAGQHAVSSGRLCGCVGSAGDRLVSLAIDGGVPVAVTTRVGLGSNSTNATTVAITQRFTPAPDNAIRWEVEIRSDAAALWGVSTPEAGIFTDLVVPESSLPAHLPNFWTGYGGWPPPSGDGFFEPFSLQDLFAAHDPKRGETPKAGAAAAAEEEEEEASVAMAASEAVAVGPFLRMGCTPMGSSGLSNYLCDASDGGGTGTASDNLGPPQWPIPLFTLTEFSRSSSGGGGARGNAVGLSVLAAPNDTIINSALRFANASGGGGGGTSFSIVNWNHRLGQNVSIR
jgi:hypothetical protein